MQLKAQYSLIYSFNSSSKKKKPIDPFKNKEVKKIALLFYFYRIHIIIGIIYDTFRCKKIVFCLARIIFIRGPWTFRITI